MGNYMTKIDSALVIGEIRSHGYSLTEMAVMLQPYYEERTDAYHHFKYWLKNNRMPVAKHNQMKEILDGTL